MSLPPSRPGVNRWLLPIVLIAVIAVMEALSDSLLDEVLPFPRDTLLVVSAVVILGLAFAAFAFRRIDTLTGELRAQNAELEARGAAARALHRVSLAIASLSDVELVLAAVVTHARELLGADVAVLLLQDDEGRLVPRAAAPPLEADGGHGQAPEDAGRAAAQAAQDPAAAMLPFVDPSRAVVRLAAPLQRGSGTIGLLAVGCAAPRGFDADDVETLASLANQATIALEHARLEARLRDLAVVEERERIARELHDGIAQVLAYVNTKTLAVDGYLEGGRIPEARIQLSELGSAARAVYVDVRESILGLSGPIAPGQGLGAALAAHARRVAVASGFALELEIDPEAASLRLDPDAEANLYRIVQEAFTNIRKHAGARRVALVVRVRGGELQVRVDDNGRGLPAAGSGPELPGYGLRGMRERAAHIGAALVIENLVDGGVRVLVTLPLAGHLAEGASMDGASGDLAPDDGPGDPARADATGATGATGATSAARATRESG